MGWFRNRKPSASEEELRLAVQRAEELARENEKLRADNLRLQKQAMQKRPVSISGYLSKMRMGYHILTSDTELRYFTLTGTILRTYKTEKDTAFNPKSELDIMGCQVLWHGVVSRSWAFSILTSSGEVLMKLSSAKREVAETWYNTLGLAGCSRAAREEGTGAAATVAGRKISNSRSMRAMTTDDVVDAGGLGVRSLHRSTTALVDARGSMGDLAAARAARWETESTLSESTDAGSVREGSVSGTSRGGVVIGGGEPTTAAAAAASAASRGGGGGESTAAPSTASGEGGGSEAPAAASSSSAHPRGPMLGSSPVHWAARYSYLSSERHWQEKHTGMYNLAAVILFATNVRLAIENALKYGWRFNPINLLKLGWGVGHGEGNLSLVLAFPSLLLFMAVALAAEKLAAQLLSRQEAARVGLEKKGLGGTKQAEAALAGLRSRHEWAIFMINLVNTSAVLALPSYIITASPASNPLPGGVLIMLAIVLWMKLVSYAHCNWELRWARRRGIVHSGERGSPDTPAEWALLRYPENLSWANLLYFGLAPTLCYQVNYPRSSRVRVNWLARRVAELVVMLTVLSIIISQYIEPAVQNSMRPLQQMDWWRLMERVLKLSVPSLYAWVTIFYCLFHLWLNILAELLRFGDREFYKDWWNAATVADYWRLWNMPVHKWLLRHCYFPAIRAGLPKMATVWLTFFVSAVAHELVLGVPLQMVRLWAFSGIMLQVPLIYLTEMVRKRLNRDELGNFCFWITFCIVGQPLSMIMYYHDFIISHIAAKQSASA